MRDSLSYLDNLLISVDAKITVSRNYQIIGERVTVNFVAQLVTPLILSFSVYNSKTTSVIPICFYRIVISMIRCIWLQTLNNSTTGVQSHLKFSSI